MTGALHWTSCIPTSSNCARSLPLIALCFEGALEGAKAGSIEDFYWGKEIQLYVGNPPGGGYDAYGRFLARFIGQYIPGRPGVVVINKPGAAGLNAANYVANIAPKDGTALALPNRNNAVDPLFNNLQAKYDPKALNWLGSMNTDVSVCGAWHTSQVSDFDSLQAHGLVVGATGRGDDTYDLPTLLSRTIDAKFRVVLGYPGGNDIDLAVERGELQGRCGMSYSTLIAAHPNWLNDGLFKIILQLSDKPHRFLQGVPAATSLHMTDRQREIMKFVFARQRWGRPVFAPSGLPEERVNALREAFSKAVRSPEAQLAAKTANLDLQVIDGAEMQADIFKLYATPSEVITAARDAIK